MIRHLEIEGLPVPMRMEDRGYKTPCYVFAGRAEVRGGYGQIRRKGRNRILHRAAWEQANGPVPRGKELDHLCRVRRCFRTDHLEPVTATTNRRRGLLPKLTIEKARAIRRIYASGAVSQQGLADEHGVSRAAIRQVLAGVAWRD